MRLTDNSKVSLIGQELYLVFDNLQNGRTIGNNAQESNPININKRIRILIIRRYGKKFAKNNASKKDVDKNSKQNITYSGYALYETLNRKFSPMGTNLHE